MQVLVSIFVPSPHVTLHSDSDHSVYPPSIATRNKTTTTTTKKKLLVQFYSFAEVLTRETFTQKLLYI